MLLRSEMLFRFVSKGVMIQSNLATKSVRFCRQIACFPWKGQRNPSFLPQKKGFPRLYSQSV